MAMYLCDNCDNWCDDDWNPMQEHPWRKRLPRYKYMVVCDECSIELEEELWDAMLEDEWEDRDE